MTPQSKEHGWYLLSDSERIRRRTQYELAKRERLRQQEMREQMVCTSGVVMGPEMIDPEERNR